MGYWTNISRRELAARRVAWVKADGHADTWTRWVDDAGGELWRYWERTPVSEACPKREVEARSAETDAISPADATYPERLKSDSEVRGMIWTRGDFPGGPVLAVVGTRSVDFEGIRLAKEIVGGVARAGVAIASGGARGVDTVAHEAALAAGAATVAFLPSGFDNLTPKSNLDLFDRIAGQGVLVTEYPAGVTPRKYHFHRRNHLIASYADAVLVIRSKRRGGTMITARAAQAIDRPLFVVPGSPEDDTSAGCLKLLREGARPIRRATDLLADMGWGGQRPAAPGQLRLPESERARKILDALDPAADPDRLARELGLPVATVHAELLELELAGLVQKRPGSALYRRTER